MVEQGEKQTRLKLELYDDRCDKRLGGTRRGDKHNFSSIGAELKYTGHAKPSPPLGMLPDEEQMLQSK